jgi:glyoxylate/hydroxypyruvate reductase A
MRTLFWCPWPNADEWLSLLRQKGPELEFLTWPEIDAPETIEAAIVWQPPAGLLDGLSSLRCICALGAGVDHLLAPGMRLPDVPLVRIADPVMAERMASWVLAAVLYGHRQLDVYVRQQRERSWRRHVARDTADVSAGVMGLGAMGKACAMRLAQVGYGVAGWTRTAKAESGIEGFTGNDALPAFLARSDFLICLLPLTPETRGILNERTFRALPEGAFVVNAGRGGHLIESDLISALDDGHLAGAVLDVFEEEPPPAEHPLWAHPKVLVTPHVASITNPRTGAEQIITAIRAIRRGEMPPNTVDRRHFY